jgi:methyl-accepting chemotaxis protein
LFWILKSATRPITALTDVMARLFTGELDAVIPTLDRFDEGRRMAHAVEVFKRNAIEVERLSAEQARIKEQSDRDRVEWLDGMASRFESTVAAVLASVAKACVKLGARAESVAGRMTAAERRTREISSSISSAASGTQVVRGRLNGCSAARDVLSANRALLDEFQTRRFGAPTVNKWRS